MRRPILALCLPLLAIWTACAHAHPMSADTSARRLGIRLPAPPRTPRVRAPLRVAPTDPEATKRRYYIANDDHTDYMWSATDTEYRGAFTRMLDYYMAQAEQTASAPWDLRGRFNMDGTIWVSEYEKTHTPSEFQRLVGHLRDSSLTMPINTCVQLFGAMPAEAVLRSGYYAGRLERRENLRFSLVVPMENQTLPGGVASLWAGSGARFSWKGICDCATCVDANDREFDIYRFVGPDGKGVLMKWNSTFWGNKSLGGYAEAAFPNDALDIMQSDQAYLNRWPYDVRAAFGYGWDNVETETNAFLDIAAARATSNNRVIVSNELDFFLDFEAAYGATLPTFGHAFGNEWDLLVASLSEPTAKMKRAVEKLRTAEALATVASLYDPAFMAGREAARDSMTLGCGLYYEHSFSDGPGVTQQERATWERSIQAGVTSYVETLHADALARLGTLMPGSAGAQRFAVFNPLSWTRTDVADLDIQPVGPFHVIDVASQAEVPSQLHDGRVRILATVIPSVGYRVYEVRSGPGQPFLPAVTIGAGSLDNGRYQVTLGGRGEIVSLIDHADGDRELVASGGAVNDIGSGTGLVFVEETGPVSATLHVTSGGFPAHETRLTLFAGGIDRIDVENTVTENFGDDLLAYTSAFALPGAVIRHEEVGMIARVARAADGGDYADENARTDWLTLNHFVDLSQASRGVTVSAWDSPFFQAGNSTVTTLDASTPTVRCLVGMTLPCASGISGQDGDTQFLRRFAFRAHPAWNPAEAMRFSLAHQNPLVSTPVTGADTAPLPAGSFSLVSLQSSDVLLWALKPAEEGIGQGVIARVWNLADAPRTAILDLPNYVVADARTTTHLETNIAFATRSGNAVAEPLERQEMHTWRLYPISTSLGVVGCDGPDIGFSVFPNPGTRDGERTVTLTLARAAKAHLTVHDLRGARIATIADGMYPAGRHEFHWRPGGRVAPGVYFVRGKVDCQVIVGRTLIVR